MQVTIAVDSEVNHAVFANLLQHVIEETKSRLDIAIAIAVEVNLHQDIRFLGGTTNLCSALATKSNGCCFVPALSSQPTRGTVYLQETTTDVLGELTVCFAVANDVATLDIIFRVVDVFLYQSRVRLASRGIVLWEVGVDKDIVKLHTLSFQRVENKVLYRPERVFRKSISTQSVLIADHYKLIICMLTQENEVRDGAWYELQFLEAVNLLVFWFTDDGPVTIDKEYFLHCMLSFCCSCSSSFASILP